jgi:hypothetical protein
MDQPPPSHPLPGTSTSDRWAVWRMDDNGNTFLVRENLNHADVERMVADFIARGHKQTYWAPMQAPQDEP